MPNTPKKIVLREFSSSSCPLEALPETRQKQYLKRYLTDLGAKTVLEEPRYFDRDYLSEFAAFYSKSAAGYPNYCKRLHFFSEIDVSRNNIRAAAGGSPVIQKRLQQHYLGFVVIRPIPATPFGRTVLVWYPDNSPNTPRVTSPARSYSVHVAGIKLSVHGLAWQQQDSGVGACATVGLWSMLHTSALDDHHAIPTTADITRAAHKTASLGSRVFPSEGLRIEQICEAIKENDLSPILLSGDINNSQEHGFSAERFNNSCASFIRSGYPVLIVGRLGSVGLHAICAVGFRSCAPPPVSVSEFSLQDTLIPNLYIHDDNLGPNVRFKVHDNGPNRAVELIPDSPVSTSTPPQADPLSGYPSFTPELLLVAAHNDLRASPDTLNRAGIRVASDLAQIVGNFYAQYPGNAYGITLSTRHMILAEYMTRELGHLLRAQRKTLGRVRLALHEQVQPMSLHLGIVRVGLTNGTPLADVLYDTTDSDRNHSAFAFVFYQKDVGAFLNAMAQVGQLHIGIPIDAC
ncbi:hypothetical protein [Salinisphaera sp. T31B1]|uniref:hypothetical protein n=1 Tax=Salinisphaera sp. T31B1 TaxID=727963 RepID=UPI00334287A4